MAQSGGRYSALTKLYIGLVIVAGWAVLLASLRLFPIEMANVNPLVLLLFVGLAIFGESYDIQVSKSAFGKSGMDKIKLGMGTIVHVSCMLLFQPPVAAAIAGFGMITDRLLHHKSIEKVLFNTSNMLLSVGIPGLVLWWIYPSSPLSVPADRFYLSPLLMALGGILYYLIDTVIVSGIQAFVNRVSLTSVWLTNERVVLLPELAETTVGALAAVVWTFQPVFIVLFALPAVIIHGTYQRVQETETVNRSLQAALAELNATYDTTLHALVKALDLRDTDTELHSLRVVAYAQAIAEAKGIAGADLEALARGALLHDVGKIGIRDAVLQKPEALTPEEWLEMRQHPTLGYRMLAGIGFLEQANQVVLQHHERYDGRGYPLGLAGNQIGVAARIFAVADALDAMTSDRPYRPALSWETSYEELERCSGTQFDPSVVAAAQRCFPVLQAIHQTMARRRGGGALLPAAGAWFPVEVD